MDGAAAAAAAAAAARARKKNVSLPGPPYAVLGGLPDYSDRPHSPVSTLGAGGKWFRLDEASSRALGTTPVAPATPCEALSDNDNSVSVEEAAPASTPTASDGSGGGGGEGGRDEAGSGGDGCGSSTAADVHAVWSDICMPDEQA